MVANTNKVKFYNHEFKKEFLKKYDEATRKTYERVLLACTPFEKEEKKDICEFKIKEMEPIIHSLDPSTVAAAQSIFSAISAYIDYAIENGIKKKNKVNQAKGFNRDFFEDILTEDHKLFHTDTEIQRILNRLVNPQDSSLIHMIYNGVQGEGCAEIVNLKKWIRGDAHETPDGADWGIDPENNLLRLTDADGKVRVIEVSQECIDEVLAAAKQTEYDLKNGEVSGEARRTKANLNTNDYVIRNSITRLEKQNEAADKHTVYRRFSVIADVLGLEHFTVKNISRSGMMKMGRDFLAKNGEITDENYKQIAKQFKFKNIQQLKEIINEKTVKDLYGASL